VEGPLLHVCSWLGSGKGPEGSEELHRTVFSKDCLGKLSLTLLGSFSPWREARGSFPMAQLMHGDPGQEQVTSEGSCFKACAVIIGTAP